MSSPSRRSDSRASVVALALLVSAFVLVTGWLAATINVWRDEAYTLWIVASDLPSALERAVSFSHGLPLYYVLLYAWSLAWDSFFLDRLLSVACAAGAIVAAWALSRRLLPKLPPLLLPLLLATHPLVVWSATELRPYALVLLLSTLLLLTWEAAYWSAEDDLRRWRLALVLLATAGVYTQHYLGYLLASLGAGLVASGRYRAAFRYARDMVVVGVLCLPIGWVISNQVGNRIEDVVAPPPLARQVRMAAERAEAYVFPLTSAAIEGGLSQDELRVAMRTHRAAVLACLLVLLASLRGRWRRLLSPRHRAWTAIVAVYGAFFVFSISTFGISVVSYRHTISVLPATLATALLWFQTAPRRGLAFTVAGLMLAGNLATTTLRHQPLAKECDCARAAAWIQAGEAPGEPILVFIAEDVMPLRHHYRGVNALIPIPRDPIEGLEHWDPRLLVLRDASEVKRALDSVDAQARAIWVFKSGTEEVYGFSFGREHLERFLSEGWRETNRIDLGNGVLVRRFERDEPEPSGGAGAPVTSAGSGGT